MHPEADRRAANYLRIADAVFGRRVAGMYAVGSAALGGFRPRQSDLDLVVVLDEERDGDVALIRKAHRRAQVRAAAKAAITRNLDAGASNCVYLSQSQLTRPVSEIEPIGSHVGPRVTAREAFDVNPVQWKVFAEHGVALRGPEPSTLGLRPQPELLRQWNLENLNSYWAWSSSRCAEGKSPNSFFHSSKWSTAWGVTGPVRLHATITTGDVITKQQACDYALDTFNTEWHPVINEARAYLSGDNARSVFRRSKARLMAAGKFGLHVIESANAHEAEQPRRLT